MLYLLNKSALLAHGTGARHLPPEPNLPNISKPWRFGWFVAIRLSEVIQLGRKHGSRAIAGQQRLHPTVIYARWRAFEIRTSNNWCEVLGFRALRKARQLVRIGIQAVAILKIQIMLRCRPGFVRNRLG